MAVHIKSLYKLDSKEKAYLIKKYTKLSLYDYMTSSTCIRKLPNENAIVGWIVSINGDQIGKIYTVYLKNNGIIFHNGRLDNAKNQENSDFCVYWNADDLKIQIFLNSKRYRIYLNQKNLMCSQELHSHDVIRINRSEYLFVALCCDHFYWK